MSYTNETTGNISEMPNTDTAYIYEMSWYDEMRRLMMHQRDIITNAQTQNLNLRTTRTAVYRNKRHQHKPLMSFNVRGNSHHGVANSKQTV